MHKGTLRCIKTFSLSYWAAFLSQCDLWAREAEEDGAERFLWRGGAAQEDDQKCARSHPQRRWRFHNSGKCSSICNLADKNKKKLINFSRSVNISPVLRIRIQICIKVKKQDPDPHQSEKQNPDPHQSDADTEHFHGLTLRILQKTIFPHFQVFP